jgi:hypothetical protein
VIIIWTWIKNTKAITWVLVILSVGVLVLVMMLKHEKAERLAAERQVEATELKAKGDLVAEDTKAAGLKKDLASLEVEFAGLQAALDDAKKKSGATKLVEADKFETTPVLVPYESSASADGGCVLAAGESGEIRIAEFRLQTKLGNVVAGGVAEAWRVAPGEPARLFSSEFSATTSLMNVDLSQVVAPKAPGWGLGPWATGSTVSGVGGGLVGTTPVVPLVFGLSGEGVGSFSVGQHGNVVFGAGFVIR